VTKARLLWIGYLGKSSLAHVDVLKRLRQKDLIEFCAASGGKPQSADADVLDEPVISHWDALFANYEKIGSYPSENIDRQSYTIFSAFEGETLRMMDRLHDRGPRYPFEDDFNTRRKMFIKHCLFWSQYLKKNEISHVIFNGLPHEVYTFVLFKIASSLKISTLILHPEKIGIPRKTDGVYFGSYPQKTMHQSLFYVSESIEDVGVWNLSQRIKEASKNFGFELVNGDPLSAVVEAFNHSTAQPIKIIRQSSLLRFFKELKNVSKRPREIYLFSRRAFLSNLQREEHSKIAKSSESHQNVAIYFLPFQPEESSSPRAGIFVEQFFAIKNIADSLPDGWILRVREHPDQYGRRRPRARGFLREISDLPRVSIVPLEETLSDSFDGVRVVVGVSGTSCIEAWFRKIPLLLFGDMFLKNAPGVFFIETLADIRDAFEKIQRGLELSQVEIDEFISWTSENSYVGSLGKTRKSLPDLHKNTVNNLEAIISTWFHLT